MRYHFHTGIKFTLWYFIVKTEVGFILHFGLGESAYLLSFPEKNCSHRCYKLFVLHTAFIPQNLKLFAQISQCKIQQSDEDE